MNIELFDYDYPLDLIAQYPLEDRSASRLMVVDPSRRNWEHQSFTDFTSYFGPEDLLIFNDVRVMPSRLYGKTEQGRWVELLLLEQKSETEWACLVRPANKIHSGTPIHFSPDLSGTLSGEQDRWEVRFEYVGAQHAVPLQDTIAELGLPPLPPYIKRDAPFETKAKDVQRYQTIYAKNAGAAAAPTAGFHFTDDVMQQLVNHGCEIDFITLHVGRDTFQPVRSETIEDHPMHGESYELPKETAEKVMRAKREGRRITAVGTTTVRALESAWDDSLRAQQAAPLRSGNGYTEKFIYPGYKFQVVDRLLTNFHQPKSTLLMLISAFAGRDFILSAYREAIREKYRLFSFGDAMLVLNCT